MTTTLEPGDLVTNPGQPHWGTGQVQSVIAGRVTVNFPHAGKLVLQTAHVDLVLVTAAGPLEG